MKRLCFLVLILQSFIFFITADAQPVKTAPVVKVTGDVVSALTLNMHDLDGFQQTVITRKGKDNKEHTYAGVLLSLILQKAGVTMGEELRGKNLRKYVLISAADGYNVVFALAELDKDFNDNNVILATSADGKPLDSFEGPFHVIVQADKIPARSIRQVTAITVETAK